MIVVDSDILVDVIRRHPPALSWFASQREEPVVVPGYVAMELNLGLLDSLIAFTAIELGETLHTFNQKHYAAIRDLKTVQPYAH
jgi:hypothetical protein